MEVFLEVRAKSLLPTPPPFGVRMRQLAGVENSVGGVFVVVVVVISRGQNHIFARIIRKEMNEIFFFQEKSY